MGALEKIKQEQKIIEGSFGRTFLYIAIIPSVLFFAFLFMGIVNGLHSKSDVIALTAELVIAFGITAILIWLWKRNGSRVDMVDERIEQVMNSIGFYSETDFDRELSEMEEAEAYVYMNERYAVNFREYIAVRMEDIEKVEAVRQRRRHAKRPDHLLKLYMKPDGHELLFVNYRRTPCDELMEQFMSRIGK